MTLGTTPNMGDPFADELGTIRDRWGHMVGLGIVLIVLGSLAIMASFIATLAITVTFGFLIAAAGLVQIVTAFWGGLRAGLLLHLLLGILYLVAGILMVLHPIQAAAGITLVLAAAYMAGGLMRIVAALTIRTPGAAWVFINGLITLGLGILVWSQWPWDSLWVIGLFVGIDMLFTGWSWVMVGSSLRPAAAPPAGGTPASSPAASPPSPGLPS